MKKTVFLLTGIMTVLPAFADVSWGADADVVISDSVDVFYNGTDSFAAEYPDSLPQIPLMAGSLTVNSGATLTADYTSQNLTGLMVSGDIINNGTISLATSQVQGQGIMYGNNVLIAAGADMNLGLGARIYGMNDIDVAGTITLDNNNSSNVYQMPMIVVNNRNKLPADYGSLNITGTVNFNSLGQIASNITNIASGGALNITDGAVIITQMGSGALPSNLNVSSGGTLNITSGGELSSGAYILNNSGSVLNAGVITIDSGAEISNNSSITNTGTLTFGAGGVYSFSVSNASSGLTGGLITGDIELSGNADLKPVIALGTNAGDFEFITGTVSGSGDWNLATNNVYDLSLTENKTLTIANKTESGIIESVGANQTQAKVIGAVLDGGLAPATTLLFQNFNSTIESINADLQSSDDAVVAAGLRKVSQLGADSFASTQGATVSAIGQSFSAAGNRMTGGAISSAPQGWASGDVKLGQSGALWAQGVISHSKLRGDNGFDSDATGFSVGMEGFYNRNLKIGVGYSYSAADIKTSLRTTDVFSNTMMLYGEYKRKDWFANAVASYSYGSYAEESEIKTSDYEVLTFAGQLMTGYDINRCGLNIVPEVGLRYLNIDQHAYMDSLGNNFSDVNSNILTTVASVGFSSDIQLMYLGKMTPMIQFAATYDAVSDINSGYVKLANGSGYVAASDGLDKFGAEIDVGVSSRLSDALEISLSYLVNFRTDYTQQSGLLSAKYKF